MTRTSLLQTQWQAQSAQCDQEGVLRYGISAFETTSLSSALSAVEAPGFLGVEVPVQKLG